jgi:hypothetical protein
MLRRAFTTVLQKSKDIANYSHAATPPISQKEIDAHALARHMGYFTRATGASSIAAEVLFEMRAAASQKQKAPCVHAPLKQSTPFS